MSCICIDELRPASFRGVTFYVKNDKGNYGRRIITHEYPNRDRPYNEDMGEKAQKYSVTGYVFGENWIGLKDAVVNACRAQGPALLNLPAEGPKLVVCNSLSVSRSKDECGYFEFSMEFTSEDNAGAATPVGVFESLIGQIFRSAIAPFTAYFDAAYRPDNTLQFAVDNQLARVSTFAADAVSAVNGTPSTDNELSASVAQAAVSIYQNVQEYVQPDWNESIALAAQPLAAEVIGSVVGELGIQPIGTGEVTVKSGSAAIVPFIAYIVDGIGNSSRIDDAVRTLTTFASWSLQETPVASLRRPEGRTLSTARSVPVSLSVYADATMGEAFCGMVRSFALMKLAQALATREYRTRREAIDARSTIVELFGRQISLFEEDAIVNILLDARNTAVKAITQRMATIVPVLTINAPQSRPSLYWANRLYEDVGRAEELSERNAAYFPAFMPVHFEALAR